MSVLDEYTSRSVYFEPVSPYVAGAAIGAFFIGLGESFKVPSLSYAGVMLGAFCFIIGIWELFAAYTKHITAINIERLKNNLPLIGDDAKAWHKVQVEAQKAILAEQQVDEPEIDTEPALVPDQDNPKSITVVSPEKKPPVQFIQELWTDKLSTPPNGNGLRRVKGEEWVELNTEWKEAGEYFRLIAKKRYIRGRDGQTKKPGYLIGTAEECILAFYPPT